jgi:hypothetical protein
MLSGHIQVKWSCHKFLSVENLFFCYVVIIMLSFESDFEYFTKLGFSVFFCVSARRSNMLVSSLRLFAFLLYQHDYDREMYQRENASPFGLSLEFFLTTYLSFTPK